MNYTFRDVWDSLPKEKRAQDGLWTRFVLRPLSMLLTVPALAAGLSANAVSWFSVLCSLAGGVLFSLPGFALPLAGALCFNLFSICDCMDGNIARVRKTAGPWGGWADAVTGFIAYTMVFLSSGVWLYLRTGWWPFLIVTGFTSSANLLTRVSYQIYKNIVGETAHGSVSFERTLAENVGVTGFLMPALAGFHAATFVEGAPFGVRAMEALVWFNAAFYGGGCLFTIAKAAWKGSRGRG
jgi:phosphatidylglycerophosphate synthase